MASQRSLIVPLRDRPFPNENGHSLPRSSEQNSPLPALFRGTIIPFALIDRFHQTRPN